MLTYKDFSLVNFALIGLLSIKTVVLDVEAFASKKKKFYVKEFVICTENYLDCVSFLTPTSYSELTTEQKQSFNWLSRNLHGND